MSEYVVKALVWPAIVGDIADREAALKEREKIRSVAAREAFRGGHETVRIVDRYVDKTLDVFTVDPRVFAIPDGTLVRFPSRSSASMERIGTVTRTTATRALIAYRFRSRAAKPKWVHLADAFVVVRL